MKHSIRINGEVKEIDCELGSSRFDKHGREIFVNDRLKFKVGTRKHTGRVFLSTSMQFYIRDDNGTSVHNFEGLGLSFYDVEIVDD